MRIQFRATRAPCCRNHFGVLEQNILHTSAQRIRCDSAAPARIGMTKTMVTSRTVRFTVISFRASNATTRSAAHYNEKGDAWLPGLSIIRGADIL